MAESVGCVISTSNDVCKHRIHLTSSLVTPLAPSQTWLIREEMTNGETGQFLLRSVVTAFSSFRSRPFGTPEEPALQATGHARRTTSQAYAVEKVVNCDSVNSQELVRHESKAVPCRTYFHCRCTAVAADYERNKENTMVVDGSF